MTAAFGGATKAQELFAIIEEELIAHEIDLQPPEVVKATVSKILNDSFIGDYAKVDVGGVENIRQQIQLNISQQQQAHLTLVQFIALVKEDQLNEIDVRNQDGLLFEELFACRSFGDTGGEPFKESFADFINFDNANPKVMVLFGDAGSGKSSTLRHYAKELWDSYEIGSGDPLPLWLPLDDKRITDAQGDLLEQYLQSFLDKAEGNHTLSQLKTEHQLIILFDGYDELTVHGKLYANHKLQQWKVKVVIGCRTQSIVGVYENYNDLFYPNGAVDHKGGIQWILQPFTEQQIKNMVAKHCESKAEELKPPWDKPETYEKAFNSVTGLKSLVQNPYLCTITLDFLPYESPTPEDINRYGLLKSYVAWHMSREESTITEQEQRRSKKNLSFTVGGVKEQLEDFSERIALEMFLEKEENKPYQPAINKIVVEPSELKRTAHPLNKFFYQQEKDSPSDYQLWQRKGCLLRPREASAGKKEVYHYSFPHKSLLEYFALRRLIKEIKEAYAYEHFSQTDGWQAESLYELCLNKKQLNEEDTFLEMLTEQVKEDEQLEQALQDIILLSKERYDISIASANAATILNQARFNFSHQQWSGVKVPGANLREALLYGADLEGADLRSCDLTDSSLSMANLEHSKMGGVNFGRWPDLRCQNDCNAIAYNLPVHNWRWQKEAISVSGIQSRAESLFLFLRGILMGSEPYAIIRISRSSWPQGVGMVQSRFGICRIIKSW